MSHPLRFFMPNVPYECTTRTIQGRYLARPSAELRKRIIGILARANVWFPEVAVHAFAVLSNHWEIIASSTCGEALSRFLGYANSNIARECGRANDWTGPFWARRVRMIPILDDNAAIERLKYCMAQGAKEGLVDSPLDWPGAHAAAALVGNMTLAGEWIDRDAKRAGRYQANLQRKPLLDADFTTQVELRLVPIRPFAHLSIEQLAAEHRKLLGEVLADVATIRNGKPSLGVEMILAQHPHDAPQTFAPTPAPTCHSSSTTMATNFRTYLAGVKKAFSEVANAIRLIVSPFARRRHDQRDRNAATSGPRSENLLVCSMVGPGPLSNMPASAAIAKSPPGPESLAVLLAKSPEGTFMVARSVRPIPVHRNILHDLTAGMSEQELVYR